MDLYAPKDKRAIKELMKRHYQKGKVFKVKIWPQDPKKLSIPRDVNKKQITKQVNKRDQLQLINEELGINNDLDDMAEARLALESIGKASSIAENTMVRESACR